MLVGTYIYYRYMLCVCLTCEKTTTTTKPTPPPTTPRAEAGQEKKFIWGDDRINELIIGIDESGGGDEYIHMCVHIHLNKSYEQGLNLSGS